MAAETKKKEEEAAVEEESAAAEKPKRKPAGKAPAKPLPQMMEEDVIPSLKSTLQAQDDITELELSFNDNKVTLLSHKSFRSLFLSPKSCNEFLLFVSAGRFVSEEGLSIFLLGVFPQWTYRYI